MTTARPAKRQKRLIILDSSDNEPDDAATPGSSTIRKPISKSTIKATKTTSSPKRSDTALVLPKRSPSKRKKSTKPSTRPNPSQEPKKGSSNGAGVEDRGRRTIHTFFATSGLQEKAVPVRVRSGELVAEVEDLIQDDSFDEDMFDAVCSNGSAGGTFVHTEVVKPPSSLELSHRQRFVKTNEADQDALPPSAVTKTPIGLRRPWAEEYVPLSLEELAVHKNKVADVRRWLENVYGGRSRQCVLVLTGASGTGKTSTVQLLSQALNADLLEWRNPQSSAYTAGEGYTSLSAQFDEFINRGGTFSGLDLRPTSDRPSSAAIFPSEPSRRILLVEDFPNTFTRSGTALQAFRTTIQTYLASNTPSLSLASHTAINHCPVTPLILIISETLLTTTSSATDSFTAHRLLGPSLLHHPSLTTIEFNPIARTLLTKALHLVIRKAIPSRTLSPAILDSLSSSGDIRSAILSLEFYLLGVSTPLTLPPAKRRKNPSSKSTANTDSTSLALLTQRESSLGIFHAVGRVVYNKRSPTSAHPATPTPPHLTHHDRPFASQVDVDRLMDETGTDIQTFLAAIHENFLLSCTGPFFLSSAEQALDMLSASDLLCAASGRSHTGGPTSAAAAAGPGQSVDLLRQEEISFQVGVRGVLFSLPHPVKRSSATSSTIKGSNAFKMFYPASARLWRAREEVEGVVDLWLRRLQHDSILSSPLDDTLPSTEGVESWATQTPFGGDSQIEMTDTGHRSGSSSAARRELILERLPYLAKILLSGRHAASGTTTARRQLETVTVFRGIDVQSEEVNDDDDGGEGEGREMTAVEEWATDKADERDAAAAVADGVSKTRKILEMQREKESLSHPTLNGRVQKLVLSDDDIEDY